MQHHTLKYLTWGCVMCVELAIAQVTFDRMIMILFMEFVIFALFTMQLGYCNTQRLNDQR